MGVRKLLRMFIIRVILGGISKDLNSLMLLLAHLYIDE